MRMFVTTSRKNLLLGSALLLPNFLEACPISASVSCNIDGSSTSCKEFLNSFDLFEFSTCQDVQIPVIYTWDFCNNGPNVVFPTTETIAKYDAQQENFAGKTDGLAPGECRKHELKRNLDACKPNHPISLRVVALENDSNGEECTAFDYDKFILTYAGECENNISADVMCQMGAKDVVGASCANFVNFPSESCGENLVTMTWQWCNSVLLNESIEYHEKSSMTVNQDGTVIFKKFLDSNNQGAMIDGMRCESHSEEVFIDTCAKMITSSIHVRNPGQGIKAQREGCFEKIILPSDLELPYSDSVESAETLSVQPSTFPSIAATPSGLPSGLPTVYPSLAPSLTPTVHPSLSAIPSTLPSSKPSSSSLPSNKPSVEPSQSTSPSSQPTLSRQPSLIPSTSNNPSSQPSITPSDSTRPSNEPSFKPSLTPTVSSAPSRQPSSVPTSSANPSSNPSMNPSISNAPSISPSSSRIPSSMPSFTPTLSSMPSTPPSITPSKFPSSYPSGQPSSQPSQQPSIEPCEVQGIITEVADPKSDPTNRFVELYFDQCQNYTIDSDLWLIRKPKTGTQLLVVPLKDKTTSSGGFITLCNSNSSVVYEPEKCDYNELVDAAIDDTIAIVRGDNPIQFDEVLDVYGDIFGGFNNSDIDISNGRAVRRTSVVEPKPLWDVDDWVFKEEASAMEMDPHQWWDPTIHLIITEIADPIDSTYSRSLQIIDLNIPRFVELYTIDEDMHGKAIEDDLMLVVFVSSELVPFWETAISLKNKTFNSEGFLVFCTNAQSQGDTDVFGGKCDYHLPVETSKIGPANSNGDDQIAIIQGSPSRYTIRDIFGVVGEDGTDTNHEFTNGRGVRKVTSPVPKYLWDAHDWFITKPVSIDQTDPGVWSSNYCDSDMVLTEIGDPRDEPEYRFVELYLDGCRSFTIERNLWLVTNNQNIRLRNLATSKEGFIVLGTGLTELAQVVPSGKFFTNTFGQDPIYVVETEIDEFINIDESAILDMYGNDTSDSDIFTGGRAVRKINATSPMREWNGDDWHVNTVRGEGDLDFIGLTFDEMDPFAWLPLEDDGLVRFNKIAIPLNENLALLQLQFDDEVNDEIFQTFWIAFGRNVESLLYHNLNDAGCSNPLPNAYQEKTLNVCVHSVSNPAIMNSTCQCTFDITDYIIFPQEPLEEYYYAIFDEEISTLLPLERRLNSGKVRDSAIGCNRRRLTSTSGIIHHEITHGGSCQRRFKVAPNPIYTEREWDCRLNTTVVQSLDFNCAFNLFITEIVAGEFIELYTANLADCNIDDRKIFNERILSVMNENGDTCEVNLFNKTIPENGFLLLHVGELVCNNGTSVLNINGDEDFSIKEDTRIFDRFESNGNIFSRVVRVRSVSTPQQTYNEKYWINCTDASDKDPGNWGQEESCPTFGPSMNPSNEPSVVPSMSISPTNVPSLKPGKGKGKSEQVSSTVSPSWVSSSNPDVASIDIPAYRDLFSHAPSIAPTKKQTKNDRKIKKPWNIFGH